MAKDPYEPSNQQRAEWARVALEAFRSVTHMRDEDLETVLQDLLTDLRHLCDEHEIDFADVDRDAEGNYIEEVEEEKQNQNDDE